MRCDQFFVWTALAVGGERRDLEGALLDGPDTVADVQRVEREVLLLAEVVALALAGALVATLRGLLADEVDVEPDHRDAGDVVLRADAAEVVAGLGEDLDELRLDRHVNRRGDLLRRAGAQEQAQAEEGRDRAGAAEVQLAVRRVFVDPGAEALGEGGGRGGVVGKLAHGSAPG